MVWSGVSEHPRAVGDEVSHLRYPARGLSPHRDRRQARQRDDILRRQRRAASCRGKRDREAAARPPSRRLGDRGSRRPPNCAPSSVWSTAQRRAGDAGRPSSPCSPSPPCSCRAAPSRGGRPALDSRFLTVMRTAPTVCVLVSLARTMRRHGDIDARCHRALPVERVADLLDSKLIVDEDFGPLFRVADEAAGAGIASPSAMPCSVVVEDQRTARCRPCRARGNSCRASRAPQPMPPTATHTGTRRPPLTQLQYAATHRLVPCTGPVLRARLETAIMGHVSAQLARGAAVLLARWRGTLPRVSAA